MDNNKPYSKSFIILVTGQIISVIGNTTVNFLLSLYVLEITGSAGVFATITAICAIPWLVAGPMGGVLADKFSKKKIMISLDFIVTILIFIVAFFGLLDNSIFVIAITKILLQTISALYSPCTSSAISYLVDDEFLLRANAIVSQINAISGVLGSILAGILYGFFDVNNILFMASAMFALSAIIECFMKIPKKSRAYKNDMDNNYSFKESLSFLFSKNKYLCLYLIISSVTAGLCINAIVTIGLPYIINIYLDLPSIYFSISSAIVGLGSFLAGAILWKLNNKINFSKSGYIFIFQGVCVCLMGLCVCFLTGLTAFVFICLTLVFIMISQSALYTLMNTFIQQITPPKMLGKVMSVIPIISGFCDPGGQIIYGNLFDMNSLSPGFIITASSTIVIAMSFFAVKFCKKA